MNKTLIAIDPGTEKSAMLVWNGEQVGFSQIVSNTLLYQHLKITETRYPLVIEMMASYGMPVGREVFETVLFIGRLIEVWESKGLAVKLAYRKEIKVHICGTTKAKDGNIRQALIDRFGAVGTKKKPGPLYGVSSHLWSALAVAVYSQDTNLV